MKNYEKSIDAFLELIIDNKLNGMSIVKSYYYKKPKYCIRLDTEVKYNVNIGGGFTSLFNCGNVAVYILFVPHRNGITLKREDCDDILIESEELMVKYEPIIEALYHKLQNDNVLDFINKSVKYLKLESENRDMKIKNLDNERD